MKKIKVFDKINVNQQEKAVTKNKSAISLMLLFGAIVAFLGIILILFLSIRMSTQESLKKELIALDALPRITIPDGHFENDEQTGNNFMLAKNVKSIKISPKIDFYKDAKPTKETLQKEIDAIFANLKTLKFNALMVETKMDDSVIFDSEIVKRSEFDALRMIIDTAKKEKISISVIIPLTGIRNQNDTLVSDYLSYENKETLANLMTEFPTKYELESILLDNYYNIKNTNAYSEYTSYGMTMGFEKWLLETSNSAITNIVQTVKSVNNSMPVGLYVKDIYTTKKQDKDGVSVDADFSILNDGFVDVKSMLSNPVIDFVNVDIKTSSSNTKMPFSTIASWWGTVCETANKPIYITHCAENADKKIDGWEGVDQLAQQLSIATKLPNYHGSVYSGLSSMIKNLKTSTDILLKKYANEYDDKDLFQGIEIISPLKADFVTYEDVVQFKGKYDPNQELKINDKVVVPSSIGGFSEWIPLTVGNNKITIEHKGVQKIYNVNRKVIIFQSVSPTASMAVTGSSTIGLKAVAYKGAKITATINGKTVTLTQGGGEENEAESLYVTYQGTYNVPPAKVKSQNIGSIKFNGNYQGTYQSKTGSNIVIDKIPEKIDPDEATGEKFEMATLKARYADTYPYETSGFPEPITYPLISGTEDIITGRNGDYLNLRSGITVKKQDVTISQKVFKGNNSISKMNIGVEGNDTVIRATMSWKSPFSLDLSPSAYYNSPTDKTIMGAENYFFKAKTVTLFFDYATFDGKNVSGNMNNSPIFSGMKMEQVSNSKYGTQQYKLTLPLRTEGKYYGCYAAWEGNTLVLKFNHPPKQSGSLSGLKIAVDPGHGGSGGPKGSGIGPGNTAGKDIDEAPLNLLYAKSLANSLRAKGADVVMMRNENESISIQNRAERAQANNCDLFISVHQNSAGSASSAYGVQTYYNAPFSQPLAQIVQGELEEVAPASKWNKWNGNHADFGFVVTRQRQYPSILVECGFMSNRSDELRGLDPAYRQRMVNAMTNGIIKYFDSYR